MSIEAELVARYGDAVLNAPRRKAVPPRRASPGKLLVSTAKPGCRKKLLSEIRQERIRAYGPPEGGRYTFSNALPAFSKHAAHVVGEVSRLEIRSLYPTRARRRADETIPFRIGQTVYRGEIPAKVIAISGRVCLIETDLLGKTHRQSIHYSQLRPG